MWRLVLNDEGYRELCKMLDDRDGGCIVCGAVSNIEHHHVTRRSHGGDDSTDNMVCLCHKHHNACDDDATRADREKWQAEFMDYLRSEKCRAWTIKNTARLRRIYRKQKERGKSKWEK